jgi:hypothetical protein
MPAIAASGGRWPAARRTGVRAAAFLLLIALMMAAPAPAAGQARGALLDVPYLAQPVRLCGGAALAMVLRYWGERAVYAEDFAPLVDAGRGGIPADALARAVTDRGWQAFPAAVDASASFDRLRTEVDRGRPVVALIEAGPSVSHFVVVVGVTDAAVVLHDPARAPFQVVPRAEFDAAWAPAERWMLLVLPPADRPPANDSSPAGPAATEPLAATPCAALVSHSVRDAGDGNVASAERRLLAATALCPGDAAGWRELAGVRFLARQYAESRQLAERAVERAPQDRHAWQLLATSRYLTGDLLGALDAWNRLGEPRTDVVTVLGSVRTPHAIVVDLVDLPPREILTASSLRKAQRRLEELPVSSDAEVRYEPIADGLATVEATIDERVTLPGNWKRWGAMGFETLLRREVSLDLAGRLGAGENLRGRYRWAANRPRVMLDFAVPAPGRLPGIASVELSWERQAYGALVAGEPHIREERRRAGGTLADWAFDWLRWEAGAAIDHIADGRYISAAASLSAQALADRVFVTVAGERWSATEGGEDFGAGSIGGGWRWTTDRARPNWTAFGGASVATTAAPLAVWPGAGTTLARGALLRAHSLTDGGVHTSEVFGRRVAFVTLEHERPFWSSPYGLATMTVFVDTARAWQRREPGPSDWHTDIGAGVRFAQPGSNGVVRLDLAYGLRDGAVSVSAGYVSAWGR